MVFGVMASLAEFERALIQDRIKAGLRRAVSQGKQIGRPKVSVDPAVALRMRQDGRTLREIDQACRWEGNRRAPSSLVQNPIQNVALESVERRLKIDRPETSRFWTP